VLASCVGEFCSRVLLASFGTSLQVLLASCVGEFCWRVLLASFVGEFCWRVLFASFVREFWYKFTSFDASWRECELAFDACEVPPKPDYDQQ